MRGTAARIRAGIGRRRPAPWRSAGIMLTYRCNASCAHCYVNSGPRRRRVLPPEDLRRYLVELKGLGLRGDDVHFAGGEPFFDYAHLLRCFEVARETGMLPLGKLETNAFWCRNDELVQERFRAIERFGISELLVSCDPFHQEFVPLERVERATRIGAEIFGEGRIRVSQPRFLRRAAGTPGLGGGTQPPDLGSIARQYPWRMVGRAATKLAPHAARRPGGTFRAERCARKLLRKRSIHLDPYGNVFPSICSGIVMGNAKQTPLAAMARSFDPADHPVVATLAAAGPVSLMAEAVSHGYREDPEGYASRCHLCFEVRRFFWERGEHTDEIGPAEIYSD